MNTPPTLRSRLRHTVQRVGVDISRYRPAPTFEDYVARLADQHQITLMLDVGANSGFYAATLRLAGYRGRTVSFEPLSQAHAELKMRTDVDPLWECRHVAVGDTAGTATMNISGNSYSSSLLPMEDLSVEALGASRYVGTETVDVQRLDELVTLEPDDRVFLKLDVQGFEERALNGATDLLARIIMVQIELGLAPIYAGQPDWRRMLDRLAGDGFRLFMLVPAFEDPRTGQTLHVDALLLRD